MASHAPQVFNGVTPQQYAKLTTEARAAGIEMNGNTGRASKMGVEVEWNYSEAKQELVLTCLQAPFFVSADQVNQKLRTLVNQVLTS